MGTGGGAQAGGAGLSQGFLHFDDNPTPGDAAGPQLAVDAQGTWHLMFTESIGTPGVIVYYGECTANCGLGGSWRYGRPGAVAMGGQLAQLAVEPTGTVHAMIRDIPNHAWVYARCASNCTADASWTNNPLPSLFVAGLTNMDIFPGWGRSFAVGPGGRLAFVVAAERFGTLDQRRGTYVATCESACTADSSWQFTHVGPVGMESEHHSLRFTASGGLRLAYATLITTQELHYAECDAQCGVESSWSDVVLGQSAGAVGLALDPAGHPRVAWFGGNAYSFTSPSGDLGYAECDSACTQAQSWRGGILLSGKNGTEGVDLAWTVAGPVIAYQSKDLELALAGCAQNCGTTGTWSNLVLEDTTTLRNDLPPLLPACPAPTAGNPNTPKAGWKPGINVAAASQGGVLTVVHVAEVLKQCGNGAVTSGPDLLRADSLRVQ